MTVALPVGKRRTWADSQPPPPKRRAPSTWDGASPQISGGQADPEPARVAGLPAAGLLVPHRLVVHQLEGPVEGRSVVGGVVDEGRDRGERELVGRDEVTAAQVGRVHPQLGRQDVDGPLDHVRGLGAAGPPVGVRGRLGGEHAHEVEEVGAHVVDAGDHEGGEDRDAGGQQLEVGAHVGPDLHPDPGDLAVAGGGQLDLVHLVPPVDGGLHVLRAALHMLDRTA